MVSITCMPQNYKIQAILPNLRHGPPLHYLPLPTPAPPSRAEQATPKKDPQPLTPTVRTPPHTNTGFPRLYSYPPATAACQIPQCSTTRQHQKSPAPQASS